MAPMNKETTEQRNKVLIMISFLVTLGRIAGAPPVLKNPPIRMTPEPIMVRAIEGENVRFECPVLSQPQAFVTWRKEGTIINQGWTRFRASGNNLRIREVSVVDEGWYTCLAVNGFGSLEVKVHLEVVSGEGNSTKGGPPVEESSPSATPLSTSEAARESHDGSQNGSQVRNTTGHVSIPRGRVTTGKVPDGVTPEEVYITVAMGMLFSAIFVCIVFIAVLARLTCGVTCCRCRSKLHSTPGKLLHSTTPDDVCGVSSSVSQLLVTSNSSLENNSREGEQTTWSLPEAAAVKDRKLGSLKF